MITLRLYRYYRASGFTVSASLRRAIRQSWTCA